MFRARVIVKTTKMGLPCFCHLCLLYIAWGGLDLSVRALFLPVLIAMQLNNGSRLGVKQLKAK